MPAFHRPPLLFSNTFTPPPPLSSSSPSSSSSSSSSCLSSSSPDPPSSTNTSPPSSACCPPPSLSLPVFTSDVISACLSALCVAPLITVIDRSIVLSTNNSQTLSSAVSRGLSQLVCQPIRFLCRRDFRIVLGLYTATYVAGNITDTLGQAWWGGGRRGGEDGTEASCDGSRGRCGRLEEGEGCVKSVSCVEHDTHNSDDDNNNDNNNNSHCITHTSISHGPAVDTPSTASVVIGEAVVTEQSIKEGMDGSSNRSELLRFCVVTLVNITLCVRKDILFAQMFANRAVSAAVAAAPAAAVAAPAAAVAAPAAAVAAAPAAAVAAPAVAVAAPAAAAAAVASQSTFPPLSSCLFVLRDCVTIFASFNAPKVVSAWLQQANAQSTSNCTDQAQAHSTSNCTDQAQAHSTSNCTDQAQAHSTSNCTDNNHLQDTSITHTTLLDCSLPYSSSSSPSSSSSSSCLSSSTTPSSSPVPPSGMVGMYIKSLVLWMGRTKAVADNCAQFICPVSVQFLTTPLHLLGLDVFNRRGVSGLSRCALIRRKYLPSLLGRVCRIGPAFGIGGIVNNNLRVSTYQLLQPPRHHRL
eukprot:GHVQ01036082.1.p1 GENE.GHVQ01036082.1~~GHVQ01036082.1.p1  ORF type:complete len:645 (-),score=186.69 GHVQ01036082.1:217-1956(-)